MSNKIEKLKNFNLLKILLDWQVMSFEELKQISYTLTKKELRWAAMIHNDNKTRENLLRLSGISIGKKTVINWGLNLYNNFDSLVKIGKNCAIAANVSLITESGPNMSELKDIPFIQKHYIKKGKILIEDNVWIGANVIVFPGVKIGKNSIVGAGSIVTKDVKPNTIVKGQPAKAIKIIKNNRVIDILK